MEWEAKRRGKTQATTVEFWFRKKYGLTPTDPRFLSMTVEDMLTDYWAHHYYDNPEKEEFDNPDFDKEVELFMGDNVDDWEDL
jgi:hypothetical protein